MVHIGAAFKPGKTVTGNGKNWNTRMSAALKQCAVSSVAVAVLLLCLLYTSLFGHGRLKGGEPRVLRCVPFRHPLHSP